MALPKIENYHLNLKYKKMLQEEIKQEIVKLGKSIEESSSLGMK